jgi:hypothetical protein
MNDKYQVCLIAPPDYKGSLIFRELIFLLRCSLVSLGYDCVIKPNNLSEDRINILVGYHLIKFEEGLSRYRYIPFQLEQLPAEGGWYSENVRLILEGAYDVWDYSRKNIEFMKALGIEAKYLPIGYHESLEQIGRSEPKEYDILFYGSMNERRKAALKDLGRIPGAKTATAEGVYGRERDDIIARSRIVLNLHYYAAGILESVRVSYLLNNACFVLTEKSDENPYRALGLPEFEYEQLTDACRYYLENESERENLRQSIYKGFKEKFKMTDLIKAVL